MGKKGFSGFPGGNMNQLMKQAQKMQKQMEDVQNEMEDHVVEGSSGGGMVKCEVNCKLEVQSVTIDPEVVDPEDVETLQDLILAAIHNAQGKASKYSEDEMGKITGGMNIPGLF
ncbi:YbaB/EbfC family nucleoid-associated protein [bacterium]|nr:YbaB/EbfC family nucleoid-associated protein [bacterium]